ncbi:M14 family metallopeptidase [Maricaulis sp.]|uniref:M14 family metallopeptidase n=1 Tax=Maricaulis sp. TaxID=1486257 RepID=UPI002634F92A|nr:M14 family metallopeptidase [Maricaulis sp.]
MDPVTLPLARYDALPDALLRIGPREIRSVFPDPALIHLEGLAGAPVFLSVLLHGNETTGFFVLQRLAHWMRSHKLPRPLIIFVGNVHATEAGVRHLAAQPDYNRIWEGGPGPEHALAMEVLAVARDARPFAAIDIHNNTGLNPHYACVNRLEPEFLHLASLFSPTLVTFNNPSSVISMAMANICPAVTVEAGKSGDARGIERAFDLVLDTLHLHAFRTSGLERKVSIYETVGRVELARHLSFGFTETSDADLVFPADLERWNFTGLKAGTEFATSRVPAPVLRVVNARREDITADFFARDGNAIRLTRDITPSMLTRDPHILREDCLCYLMQEIPAPVEA